MYIRKRQFLHDPDTPATPHDNGNIWYSPTAYVVKWSVLLALFVSFFLWITIGYYHARKRLKAGKPPLAYHRWLVPRSQRYPQAVQNYQGYYRPNHYAMHESMDPPPAYSNVDMPPTYQAPTKAAEVREAPRPLSGREQPLSGENNDRIRPAS